MAFIEDLDGFLADFGVDATFGPETAKVIFDMPDIITGGDLVISADYTMMYKTANFSGIAYADTVTINAVSYKVETVQKISDGAFSVAGLSKA